LWKEWGVLREQHAPRFAADEAGPIYDRFGENSRHVLVMEYVAGQTLEQILLAHGTFDEDQVHRPWRVPAPSDPLATVHLW
jgi:hypothetical protein